MTDAIAPLIAPQLAPIFARPPLLGVESAWYGHVPFAQWVIAVTKPATFVELGTHNGVSYAAFCEAVRHENLPTRCYAVDTWQGDEHAGFYGDGVYAQLARFHADRYAGFSELLRCTFDDALPYIPDGSIDLLHIDGRHHYDDVKHDFETWRCKLSSRATVLFHDTNVRERNFGVFRLWQELTEKYKTFEFLHGHGLGVLAYGADVPDAIAALTSLTDPGDIATLRARFALPGERWMTTFQLADRDQTIAQGARKLSETTAWAQKAQTELDRVFPLYAESMESGLRARSNLSLTRFGLAAKVEELSAAHTALSETGRALAAANFAYESHRDFATHADHEARRLDTEIVNIRASRSWRITAALRLVQALLRGTPVPMAPPLSLPPLPVALEDLPEFGAPTPILAPSPAPNASTTTLAATAPQPGRKHILFVSGESHTPGTIYRVERMAALARNLGWTAAVSDLMPVNPDILAGINAVVLWRCAWSPHVQGIVQHAHENNASVIYDVDDLMFRPEFATVEIIDGIRSQRFSESETRGFFGDIRKAMALCDLVMCPTAELADEARRQGMVSLVVPNGFTDDTVIVSRRAARIWGETRDGLTRIGYAGGSRTHQKDFATAVDAIVDCLAQRPDLRLVLFRDPSSGEGLVLIDEFPKLAALARQIEWRDMVTLPDLPREIARFDINLAPLEAGNPFCEAKSELKYFEAALVSVPTIASPTGPFRRAICHGSTGLLASTAQEWYACLTTLLDDPARRTAIAQAAYHDSLRHFGPATRADRLALALAEIEGGAAATAAFVHGLTPAPAPRGLPFVPQSEVLVTNDQGGDALVTVIIPLYNYADYIIEALESVRVQTMAVLDLIIVDDASTDEGPALVQDWLASNASRFNRVLLLRHLKNAGLGFTRNSGFAAAETPYVLPLDADNRLLPTACDVLAAQLAASRAAFAYPAIRHFGDSISIVGTRAFSARRLRQGNYIDAMALVRKSAWAEVGGYDHVPFGWEDYDFWCCLIEQGRFGINNPEILAEYRVHKKSMLRTATDIAGNRDKLADDLRRRHPWLRIERE